MRLVTFDGGRVGRIVDDRIVEFRCDSMRQYFELSGEVDETGDTFALSDVAMEAPIVPKKFFHTSGNFREHGEDLARVNWSHPVNKGIVFFQNVDAIIGPGQPVIYPEHLTRELDYELELGIIIGKPGKFFSTEQARDHIAGYVIFNDITARDIQRREIKSGVFSFCKAIDTFCPLGPWIVTSDEIDDAQNLEMELKVNGQMRQKSNTNHMSITIEELVAYHSPQGYSAGDVITTGTIAGVAAGTDDPFANYLKPGDIVDAEIEGLGILRTPIISWKEGHGTDATSGPWELSSE